jgi:hypothetical protein
MRLRHSGLEWRRTGVEVVVLDIDASTYFALNSSGALLWESLADTDFNQEQLEKRLQLEYGVNAEQARADVLEFVTTLGRHGLIEA